MIWLVRCALFGVRVHAGTDRFDDILDRLEELLKVVVSGRKSARDALPCASELFCATTLGTSRAAHEAAGQALVHLSSIANEERNPDNAAVSP